MESLQEPKGKQVSRFLLVIIVLTSLLTGAIAGYFLGYLLTSAKINNLENQLSMLQQQVNSLPATSIVPYILGENVSLPELFDQIRQSVVVVEGLVQHSNIFGRVFYTQVQGSSSTLLGKW